MTPAGGSLEDCHTNVFVLTELNGLRWKCLTTPRSHSTQAGSSCLAGDQIEKDPVLRAYGECLNQGILCAWRRKPRGNCNAQDVSQDPTPQADAQKELWIFWYSEEPACINTFKESGLVSSDDCEDDVSINYETRVLFFKTLHNVIERNLLRSGYVRFGKWFTCPLEMPVVDFERALPQYINAIKFNFFLHGEDQVCVTVNVQRQPTLLRLAPCHLRASKGQPVILGPWSMRAILLPNQPLVNNSNGGGSASSASLKDKHQPSFTEIQAAVTKQWNDWKKFQALPLDDPDSTTTSPIKSMDGDKFRGGRAVGKSSSDGVVPKMVLVEIDGVRMFYPSCFVGILADELIAENRYPSNNNVKSKERKRSPRKGGYNTGDGTAVSMSNGGVACTAHHHHHQNLADLSYSLEVDEINNPFGGGYSAEDHEVEEIMNASTASLHNVAAESNFGPPGVAGKHRFLSGNVPSSLRHCRRSYAGVRASRRSLEDGCFSVLLGAKRPDCNDALAPSGGPPQPPSSIMSSSTTSGYMSSVEEDGMSTRWNFYDYMRRDFCYCKICSSNGAAISSEIEGNGQHYHLGDSTTGERECYAFHRSPNKPVSLASDFSPTFMDELSKADESESEINSDTEVRSMWVNKVASRSDVVVSGKLDLDSPIEADILKILPVNKEFDSFASCVPPQPVSPFTPITSITPEPDGSDRVADANFLQRLKDFDYVYKPMNRDIIPSQPYHNETRMKKSIGPPSENIYLKSNYGRFDARLNVAASGSGNNGGATAYAEQSSLSVLKSLLDDDAPNSPSPTNDGSVVPMRRLLMDVGGDGGMAKAFNGAPQPVSSSARRKKNRLKRLKSEKLAASSCSVGGNGGQAEWPELQQLDTQLALIEFQDRMDKENIFENIVDEKGVSTTQNELEFCANSDLSFNFNNRSAAFPSHLMDRVVSGAIPLASNHPNFMAVAAASMDPALFLQVHQQQRALAEPGLQPISDDEMKPGGVGTGDSDVSDPSGAPGMMASVCYGGGEEAMDTSSSASSSAPITAIVDAAVTTTSSDTAMTDAMTAVTPPALLSRLNDGGEDDNSLSRPMGDDGSGGDADSDVSRHVNNQQIQQQHHPSAHAPLSSLISSIGGGNAMSEHILSPPASNERVEFGNSNGNCIQQQSFLGALGGTAPPSVMHDSLSIIYPTPPTPMQQFSPQNVMINAVQQLITTATNSVSSSSFISQHQIGSCSGAGEMGSLSQQHQSQSLQDQQRYISPSRNSGSPLLVNNSVLRANSTAGAIFDGDRTLPFPPSECFSGDLLDDSLEIEERLRIAAVNKKQLSTYSSADYGSSASSSSGVYGSNGAGKADNNGSSREGALRDAFRSRTSRAAVDLPPAYKRPPPEKIAKFGSSREAMDSDRRLAMALEKSEIALLSAVNRLHNVNFPPHHPHYHQMLQHHHNMMQQQQHFMGNPMTPSSMMPPFGGPLSMNGISNNNTNAMMMARGARGGSLMNMQQQLLQQQQQQLMNNQMAGSGILPHRPAMLPNFANNNVNNGGGTGGMQQMQMLNMLKQQQQQSMMGSLGSPSNNLNQFGSGDATMNNGGTDEFGGGKQHNFMSNGVFPPSSQQQQAVMNRFGGNAAVQKNALSNMQQMQQSPMFTNNMNNNNNSVSANTAANTPSSSTPGGTSFAPFGSPLTSVSNGGNASTTAALNYHISSVSSTSSSTGGGGAGALVNVSSVTTVSATPSGTLFGTINVDGIINTFQQGRSFVVAILLQDTVLDLHFDSVFDACPICCCNANIRTYELGFYINSTKELKRCDEIQQKQQQNARFMPDYWSGFRISAANLGSKCNCGFSAVRHRYLCGGWSGLFPEDSVEACGVLPPMLLVNRRPSVGRLAWFNPSSATDLQFMDLLRQLSLTRDFCAMVRNAYYLGDFPDPSEKTVSIGVDVTQHCDYIVSRVDAVELDKVMCGIVDAAITAGGGSDNDSSSKDSTSAVEICRPSKSAVNGGGGGRPLYHWWGLQTANNVREPKDTECIAVIRGVQPLLEEAMRQSRGSQNYIKQFEGPLTWRSFLRKTSKGSNSVAAPRKYSNDDSCQEQVPNIIVATEREPVVTSPQLVSMWEKLSLAPYDQTKDVLYLAVVPDCAVVVEKCRIFMEELSSQYEKCRFGCHVRVNVKDAPRDGIIRLNHRPTNSTTTNAATNNHNANLNFIAQFEHELDDRRAATTRLKAFVENMELELAQFFKANDAVFDRRAFHESVYRQTLHQNFTSLASSTDSSNMPPPAVPIQSPSSVLSSASGPSSANATMMMTSGGGVTQQQQQSSLQQSSISPNGVPGGSQQNQISPAAGPNSAPSASNVCGSGGGPTLEELTPDGGGNGGGGSLTPNPQQQQQQQLLTQQQQQQQQQSQQDQATMEASIEKTVEEMLSVESVGSHLPHVLVIYVVNPFLFGADAHHAIFSRVATAALLRAFNSFVNQLPLIRRPQLQLEVLSLQSLYDYTSFVADPFREDRQCVEPSEMDGGKDKMSARDCLRKIAFSVYGQPRFLLPEHTRGFMQNSMTRFGPASAFGDILDALRQRPITASFKPFKVSSSPFVLAPRTIGALTSHCLTPSSAITTNAASNVAKATVLNSSRERVLFVTYCIVGDEWLCGAVTDEQGHLLDNVLINLVATIPPPPTSASSVDALTLKYTNRSQIFDAIQRLWLYIQSVLVTDTRNWRLVIGRVGKIGHGEFKAWTETLSKRNLRTYNNNLKSRQQQQQASSQMDTKPPMTSDGVGGVSAFGGAGSGCKSCALIPGYQEMPAIISACLVTTEPELYLRIFPASVQNADGTSFGGTGINGGTSMNLFTASVSSSGGSGSMGGGSSSSKASKTKTPPGSAAAGAAAASGDDTSITHIMVFPTMLDISLEQQVGDTIGMQDDNDDFDDFFSGNNAMQDVDDLDYNILKDVDVGDDMGKEGMDTTIDNQPMATGYYISTAPALDLPDWFWSACPSARRRTPVHLKNSLHIHTGNIQQNDEIAITNKSGGGASAAAHHHPLDSTATDEVLRYVLETYNALSWMNVDFANGSRQSCLPIHVQALLRLYRGVTTLFS